MGYRDGQDVLTLSIGGPNGWTESSSAVVANRIARAGKIVTIAAGNQVKWNYSDTGEHSSYELHYRANTARGTVRILETGLMLFQSPVPTSEQITCMKGILH